MVGDAVARPGGRWRWDVVLSFAGAQRPYVERVAAALKAAGVRCFYDADEQTELWGRHLAEELSAVYGDQAATVVGFVSADYLARDWTRLERRAAMLRAVRERGEYVLPARFDDTPLPGLLADLAAVDLPRRSPEEFTGIVVDKLRRLGVLGPPTAEGPPCPPDRPPLPAGRPARHDRHYPRRPPLPDQPNPCLLRVLTGHTHPVRVLAAAPDSSWLATATGWLERVKTKCARHGASVAVVRMHCDADSMRDYLESRDAARDTWKLSFWDDYLATVDPNQRPLCTHYVVDNSRHARTNPAEQARRLASRTRAAS